MFWTKQVHNVYSTLGCFKKRGRNLRGSVFNLRLLRQKNMTLLPLEVKLDIWHGFFSEWIHFSLVHHDRDLKGLHFFAKKVPWFQDKDCWWRIVSSNLLSHVHLQLSWARNGKLWRCGGLKWRVRGLVHHEEEQRGSRGHVPKKVMWNKRHRQCYFQTMKCPSSHALHVYRDGLQRSVSFHGGIQKMRGCLLYIHRSFEKRCFGSSCIVPIYKHHWCRYHPKGLAVYSAPVRLGNAPSPWAGFWDWGVGEAVNYRSTLSTK